MRKRTPDTFIALLVGFAAAIAGETLAACACDQPTQPTPSMIAIDLTNINAEGLRGSATGLRAVHYEFCTPAVEQHTAELRSIDPTLQFMPGSRGRVGCVGEQVLVVGSTHQPAYRQILDRLAALHYVSRIVESFFE